jgi:hypothetical protein
MPRDAEVPGMRAGHLSLKKIQRDAHERVTLTSTLSGD